MNFFQKKNESEDGKVTHTMTEDSPGNENPFTITVTSEGMTFSGVSNTIKTDADLNKIAQIFMYAWNERKKLAPQIIIPEMNKKVLNLIKH